jgi:hypothetical protein
MNKLERNSEKSNIRDYYIGINKFKNGFVELI